MGAIGAYYGLKCVSSPHPPPPTPTYGNSYVEVPTPLLKNVTLFGDSLYRGNLVNDEDFRVGPSPK